MLRRFDREAPLVLVVACIAMAALTVTVGTSLAGVAGTAIQVVMLAGTLVLLFQLGRYRSGRGGRGTNST